GAADGLGVIDHHDPKPIQCPLRGRVFSHHLLNSPYARRFSRRRCEGLYIPARPDTVKSGTRRDAAAVAITGRAGAGRRHLRLPSQVPTPLPRAMALDVIVVMDPIGSIK